MDGLSKSSEILLTRRQFVLGAVGGTILAIEEATKSLQRVNSADVFRRIFSLILSTGIIDSEYSGPTIEYRGHSKQSIARIKKSFSLEVISPISWHEVSSNKPWRESELVYLERLLGDLPKELLEKPVPVRQIVLIRDRKRYFEGAGGLHFGDQLTLITGSGFSLYRLIEEGIMATLFKTDADSLKATLTHELIHRYESHHPDLLQNWIDITEWTRRTTGSWTNAKPSELIPYGGADRDPSEDLAVSASLYQVNPEALSQSRLGFFSRHDVLRKLAR